MNWDLTKIYKTKEEYQADLGFVKESISKFSSYQSHLNDVNKLLEFVKFSDEVEIKLSKLFTYAHMNFDLNQKNVEALQEYQIVYGVYMELIQASSFVNSELVSIGKETLDNFLATNEELKPYSFMIEKLFNNQAHILTTDKELLLSYFNSPLAVFNDMYDKLAVSDNSSTMVTLSDGSEVEISEANFRGYLATCKDPLDRKKVFEAVYKFYESHKNIFAAIYRGVIESNIASMKSRNYETILHSFLEHNNIPVDVFLTLVDTCKNNTEPVKRYYELRKKYLKLDELHTYDRFLELSSYAKNYSYEEGKALFFEAIECMEEEFKEKAHKVLEEGRVDVNIAPGKRTGAYSTGTYEEGPFILLNYNNTLDDVFTLAHEAGHSIHTSYSNENQPYTTANYTIFVAEVASTFNEQLLLDHLLKTSNDKDLKIVVLQNAIDGLIGTFYRQTLFADYEYQAHELGVKGLPITHESLSNIMVDLYMQYYGIDLNTEPMKKYVWCYIPHLFHTPFYVYQYATSFASSLAIYSKVKNKEENAFENYLKLLKAGGSTYPVDIIKGAGVDLTNKESFMAVVDRISDLVNQLEKLLEE